MNEGITYTVLIYTCCDIVSYILYPFIGISHCDTDTSGLEECIAFGDGGNDMTILQTAGIGVAMGNAYEGVKDVVT